MVMPPPGVVTLRIFHTRRLQVFFVSSSDAAVSLERSTSSLAMSRVAHERH
jgi:hypothetical protein